VIIALVTLPLSLLGMPQQGGAGIAARLAGRVSPEVAALVLELGTAASARGLPVDPLIQKAIEGGAKGVPSARVAAAVRLVVLELDTAAAALREGGVVFDTLVIAAGEFAITAGLSGKDITALARTGASAAALTVGLRVAGTLSAMGVPTAETIGLISIKLRSGEPASDLLLVPAQVQAEVARGVTPAQAAAGLERAAAAQARRGPPPGRGTPPPHPPAPPHP
jgi:energy-converting hydrogenase Eha subunit A